MGTTRGNVYGARNVFGPSSSVPGHKGGSGYANHNSWFGGNTKANIKYYRDRRAALGQTLWVGMDYMGESRRVNANGAVDIAGFPKDYFYFQKAVWMDKNVEKFAHLVPNDWSTWVPGEKIDVWVYTNVQSAELFLNGKSLGRKSFDIKETPDGRQYYETSNYTNDDQSLTLIDKGDPFVNTVNPGGYVSPAGTKIISASGDSEIKEGAPFGDTWLSWNDVVFEPGILEVRCYDDPTSDVVVATDKLVTATTPYAVHMKPYGGKQIMKADGDSLIFVECDVVDEAGNMVPTADNNIEFYVFGAAAIVGVVNGDNHQFDLENRFGGVQFTSYAEQTAYHGKVLCILQSNGQEGDIQLIAKSDGLVPTVINFKATADGTGEAPEQAQIASTIAFVDVPTFTVPAGTAPKLPAYVKVTYTSDIAGSYTNNRPVVWDEIDASEFATPKSFYVNGTAEGVGAVQALVKVVNAGDKVDISTNSFQGTTLPKFSSMEAVDSYRFSDFAADSPVREGAFATSSFATGNPNAMLQDDTSNWQNTFKGGGTNFLSNPITVIDTIPYSTIQFYWDNLKIFDQIDLTFIVSNPTADASGTKIPAAFRAQYWTGFEWVDVENQEVVLPENPTQPGNKLVTLSFDAVYTDKIRIGMENATPWTTDGGMRINRAIVRGWALNDQR
jgi:beta-galactosidase